MECRIVKGLGSLLLAILVGLVAIWILLKVLVGVVKLAGVLIAVGLAVFVYFAAEKLIGKGK
jgi:hypothetical protein